MTAQGISKFFQGIFSVIKTITVVDILDIIFVAVILYFAYKFVRQRRASRLAYGVIIFVLVLLVCEIVGMQTMSYIFKNIFQVGIVALLILFQPELRSALEKMGAGSLKNIIPLGEKPDDNMLLAIRETVSAVFEMSKTKTGALIVFERNSKLFEIISTGTVIDAQCVSFLLRNIFFNKAPLHDGAVIISNARIKAAGCLLPLSHQNDINRDLGTRHRAALGLSENSDAVVIVVSEETGVISVAQNGQLQRGFTDDSLRECLTSLLIHGEAPKVRKRRHYIKNQRNGDSNAE